MDCHQLVYRTGVMPGPVPVLDPIDGGMPAFMALLLRLVQSDLSPHSSGGQSQPHLDRSHKAGFIPEQ